ncbi:hypothetical protein T4C_12686 [Trichinella pseudospiralis]|uniref:Uncharacterized protein n=1 Tax=Trichinella pseudospiralis TaxID=6337 RepID=A0A0V1H1R0_TRIPS|nr:hypothetical protein T4C_12686 [Trichinella pseudospiralis]
MYSVFFLCYCYAHANSQLFIYLCSVAVVYGESSSFMDDSA